MVDIGDVAHTTGLSTATLRYYEERCLIAPVSRKGLRRQYDELVFERLALIALGQQAGFSLAEIVDLLPAGNDRDLDRAALGARADELDETIDQLIAVRDNLRHIVACPAPNHLACPSFRRLLDSALPGPDTGSSGPRPAQR